MAKPLPVASAGPSNSTSYHTSPHRRHRRKRPSSSPAPSSAVLSILATIASSSHAYAGPAPLPFLCPSLQSDPNPRLKQRTTSSRVEPPEPSPTHFLPRSIPDKYEQDSDGVWRKVGSYTLYGSTVSACVGTSCRQPTNAVSSVDDNIIVPSDDGNSTDSPVDSVTDIENSLPPGWKPLIKANENRTTLILALSMVLAFFICFFIIGCLFWRKNIKKRYKGGDLEARARRRRRSAAPSAEEVREIVAEKEIKAKQKVWARATARWKAHVRYTARQRRGKRSISSRLSQAHHSSASLDHSRTRLHQHDSPIVSRTPSRRSSIASLTDITTSHSSNLLSNTRTDSPSSPPAYHHRHQLPPIIISSAGPSDFSGHTSPLVNRSRRPSHSSHYSPPESAVSLVHAAHVATDDKSLLAKLADLASAPPEEGPAEGTSHPQVSAPEWHDEALTEIEVDMTSESERHASDSACSPFPPPPSKAATAEFYEYSFSYGDMESFEPEAEPSAPPFEEAPGSHMDEDQLVPSAPPLEEMRYYLSEGNDSDEGTLSGQAHDRTNSEEMSNVGRPPAPQTPTHDGIILPDYRP